MIVMSMAYFQHLWTNDCAPDSRLLGLENRIESREETMRDMESSFVETLLRLQQRLFEIVRLSKQ